ncbi:MAG: c-type cytochrome [Spirosoma sp.]|nr:c-type cytochrome [Spirosoma sp.]
MKQITLYSTLLPLALTAGLLLVAPSIIPPTTAPATIQHSYSGSARNDSTRLYLPDDLEATLWAEAPMFYNPTNMDIDARGRVWITEAVNYRKFNNKPDERLDHPDGERIMILQDTNGDGKADNSKVFVQDPDIVSPLGIAVVGNKIIVSCSPNLIVYTDENGDDRPDRKEILLTGFGGLDHDHALHSLVTGPDGKYYFNTGNAGPHVVTDKAGWTLRSGSLYVGGTPYNTVNHGNQVSDDGRVWTGGLALRINPDGTGLKVMGHNFRNNYETAVDSYGNLWQNDNDDQVVACRTGWLMEGSNAGYFSADGTRYWQGDQRPGQSIQTAHWHQEDPGVLPVGDMTGAGSPTGVVVYEGDALGLNYRGMLLSAEAGRNVIFSYKPEPMGAGYRMPRTNFVSSFPDVDENYKWNDKTTDTRKWFRPSDVAVGTDGAVYIADWYDPVVGGHQMDDHKGYGRIYRITPRGKNLRAPKIDLSNTKGQIDALLSPAINVRMAGFTALKAQGEKVLEPVMELLSSTNPYHRARAIFLMVHLGPEGQFEVERLLKAIDAPVRMAALRALRSITPENSKASPALTASERALLPLLGNLSLDPNAAVRREVAVAVRDMPYQDCRYIIQNLVKGYDGQDRYYLNALGVAADGKQDYVFADLRPTLPENPTDWDYRTANLVWELHPTAAVPMLAKRADAPTLSADARKQAITTLGFINDTSAVRVMIDLTKSANKDVAAQAQYWTNFRRGNDWAKLANWDELMPQKISTAEQKMLGKRQVLLDKYKSDTEKRKVALEMARTPEGGQLLVGLAAEKKLSDDLLRTVGPTILKNPDQSVRTMAKEYFAAKSDHQTDQSTQLESKPTMVASTKTNVSQKSDNEAIKVLTGNQSAGLKVFSANCATCHRYGKLGNDIGPELTQIHQKLDKDALLDAIINPSAGIVFGYEPWLITTKKGQTFYGFLVSDGGQSVVVKGATGQQHTIPTDQVASRRQYKTSLMPTADAMGLNKQQLADLTAFLLKQ